MGGFLAQILEIAPCGARALTIKNNFDQAGVPVVIKKVYGSVTLERAITQKDRVAAPTKVR